MHFGKDKMSYRETTIQVYAPSGKLIQKLVGEYAITVYDDYVLIVDADGKETSISPAKMAIVITQDKGFISQSNITITHNEE